MEMKFKPRIKTAGVFAVAATAFLGAAGAVSAAPVYGVAVDGTANTVVAAGNQSNTADPTSPNQIDFYIPLAGGDHGVFGVGGVGMSSGTFPADDSGNMDMWLRFAPVETGNSLLTLDFTDLDLFDVNDPDGFLEELEIFDAGGDMLAMITDASDPLVVTADFDEQLIKLALSVTSDPFFVKLTMGASLKDKTGKYKNTVESLTASVTHVPVPATLALMGLGLLGVGIAGRRRAR